jgi:hypothetical protein
VRHVDDHLPPLQQRVLHDLAHAHGHLAVRHGGWRGGRLRGARLGYGLKISACDLKVYAAFAGNSRKNQINQRAPLRRSKSERAEEYLGLIYSGGIA